jgi:hypothetical protein
VAEISHHLAEIRFHSTPLALFPLHILLKLLVLVQRHVEPRLQLTLRHLIGVRGGRDVRVEPAELALGGSCASLRMSKLLA